MLGVRANARYLGALEGGVAGAGVGDEDVPEAGDDVGAVGRGAAGTEDRAGAGGAAEPLTTDPGPRCPMMANASAQIMKSPARTAVAFESTVAPARAPNADWLLPPPNAAAMSPLPCCIRTTSNSSRQTIT
jgi:hypothetical protein